MSTREVTRLVTPGSWARRFLLLWRSVEGMGWPRR
jgi:hypothetical protein